MVERWQLWRKAFCPQICWLCELPNSLQFGLCEHCWQDLPRLPPRCCAGLMAQFQQQAVTASPCRLWCAALSYEAPVTRWLQAYKYNHQPGLVQYFAPLIAAQVVTLYRQQHLYLPDALVAVPLGHSRWLKRGYNQAALLAEAVGQLLGIPVIYPLRRRATRASHRLNKAERQKNLANAFYCTAQLPYRRLAIVDDVITSGATVNAIASLLQAQQPCLVDAWALAYTPKAE